jgi:hypothetical protein
MPMKNSIIKRILFTLGITNSYAHYYNSLKGSVEYTRKDNRIYYTIKDTNGTTLQDGNLYIDKNGATATAWDVKTPENKTFSDYALLANLYLKVREESMKFLWKKEKRQ